MTIEIENSRSLYSNVVQFTKKDHHFWNTLAPGMKAYITGVNKSLGQVQNFIPLRKSNKHGAGLLGLATDYLVGLLLKGDISIQITNRVGVAAIGLLGPDWRSATGFYKELVDSLFDRSLLSTETAKWPDPSLLGMALLSLAQAEVVFRILLYDYAPPFDTMPRRVTRASARKWLRSHVDDELTAEWLQLAEATRRLIAPLARSNTVIYNPIFGGYGHIIGSDGDLFADGTLFEIKTTVKKGITSQYVRQLLSYVALNRLKSVVPPIERIGIILPRQGMSWTAPVFEVCRGAGIGDVTRLTMAIKNRLTQKPQGSPEIRLPGPSRWSKPAVTKSDGLGMPSDLHDLYVLP